MKKSLKKIALVAILAFCFQPMSISADCNLPNGATRNGGCEEGNNEGTTTYTCIQGNYWFWGDCNVGGSAIAEDEIATNP